MKTKQEREILESIESVRYSLSLLEERINNGSFGEKYSNRDEQKTVLKKMEYFQLGIAELTLGS